MKKTIVLALATAIAATAVTGASASSQLQASVANQLAAKGYDASGITKDQAVRFKFLLESDDSKDRQRIDRFFN